MKERCLRFFFFFSLGSMPVKKQVRPLLRLTLGSVARQSVSRGLVCGKKVAVMSEPHLTTYT